MHKKVPARISSKIAQRIYLETHRRICPDIFEEIKIVLEISLTIGADIPRRLLQKFLREISWKSLREVFLRWTVWNFSNSCFSSSLHTDVLQMKILQKPFLAGILIFLRKFLIKIRNHTKNSFSNSSKHSTCISPMNPLEILSGIFFKTVC